MQHRRRPHGLVLYLDAAPHTTLAPPSRPPFRSWASTGAASLAAPLILAVGYIYGIRMKPAPTVDAAATDVRYQIGERTARLKK